MSVFIPVPKKGNAKVCPNYYTIALISHDSKVMLKILQARLQQYVNSELPDVQAGFRKGRGTRDQIANLCWIIKKARKFQKNVYFCFIDYAKAFDCVDHNKLWKILKEMGISDHLTVETVADFIFLDSKITADGDCSHEIKRCLLLGMKVMTNLDSILKSRDITLPTKVHLVKAMVFPVVMYGCES